SSNQNKVAANFQSNGVHLIVQNGSSGNTVSGLLESGNATCATQLLELTAHSNHSMCCNSFDHAWFEENGDGTSRACQVYFQADAGRTIYGTSFLNNQFAADTTKSSLGTAYKFSGAGTFTNF